MSIESAKAFYQRITTDPAFRAQIESYSSEERISFLQGTGYNFTEEEWETATAEILETSSPDEELNEAELAAIAGGTKTIHWIKGVFPGVVALYGVILDPLDPRDYLS